MPSKHRQAGIDGGTQFASLASLLFIVPSVCIEWIGFGFLGEKRTFND